MNIFLLDSDINKCAEFHCDKHVVKMICEYALMLSTAHWEMDSEGVWKTAYKNHPCSVWVRDSLENYIFLNKLGLALCKEYSFRYKKIHKNEEILQRLSKPPLKLESKGLTAFAQAMPDIYKVKSNPVEAYRNYYIGEKQHIANWKFRNDPHWFQSIENDAI